MSVRLNENKSTYYHLKPVRFVQNHRRLVTTLVVFGGLGAAAYLAYTNRYFPAIQYYPKRLQHALLDTPEFLARCIVSEKEPKNLKGALSVVNCLGGADTAQATLTSSNLQNHCTTLKKILHSTARYIHPDKCKRPSNKILFSSAMATFNRARDLIYHQFCTPEAKVAQCISKSAYLHSIREVKKILECGEGDVPWTCDYLKTYSLDLAKQVNQVFPERIDLIKKVALAYTQSFCIPIPSAVVDLFYYLK